MDFGSTIREARLRANLTQAQLADRSGTSQATISAYEQSRKIPSAHTLDRILAATGTRLATERRTRATRVPRSATLEDAGRRLVDVIELAAALPTRHGSLEFPGVPRGPLEAS